MESESGVPQVGQEKRKAFPWFMLETRQLEAVPIEGPGVQIGITFEQLAFQRAREVRFSVENPRLLELCNRARIGVENFTRCVKQIIAIPLALSDALSIYYTGTAIERQRLKSGELERNFVLTFSDTLRYTLALRTGATHEQAWRLLAPRVAELNEAEAKRAGKFREQILQARKAAPYLRLTAEDFSSEDKLRGLIKSSIATRQAITLVPSQELPAEKMQARVRDILIELGVPAESLIQISHESLNPYRMLETLRSLPETIVGKQREYLERLFCESMRMLAARTKDIDKILKQALSSRLSIDERLELVEGILVSMGAPQEEIAEFINLVRDIREGRRSEVDFTNLLSTIETTSTVLGTVNPRAGKIFAQTIAAISGASDEATNRYLEMIAARGIDIKRISGVWSLFSGIGRGVGAIGTAASDMLRFPDPAKRPDEFLTYLGRIWRNYWWLTALAHANTLLYAGLHAGGQYLAAQSGTPHFIKSIVSVLPDWSLQEVLHYLVNANHLMLLGTVFPRLSGFPFSVTAKRLAEKASEWGGGDIPALGGIIDFLAKHLPEGLGLGPEAMRWSSTKAVPFRQWDLVIGGQTDVSEGEHRVTQQVFRTDLADISTFVWDQYNPATGLMQPRRLNIADENIKLGGSIPEKFFLARDPVGRFIWSLPILRQWISFLDAKRQRYEWINRIWTWSSHGATAGGGPTLRDRWALGWWTLVGSLFLLVPETNVYKEKTQHPLEVVEPSRDITSERPKFREIDRRIFNSTVLGAEGDYLSSLLGVWLSLSLVENIDKSILHGMGTSFSKILSGSMKFAPFRFFLAPHVDPTMRQMDAQAWQTFGDLIGMVIRGGNISVGGKAPNPESPSPFEIISTPGSVPSVTIDQTTLVQPSSPYGRILAEHGYNVATTHTFTGKDLVDGVWKYYSRIINFPDPSKPGIPGPIISPNMPTATPVP